VQRLLSENNKRKKFLFKPIEEGYLAFTEHKAVDLSLFLNYEEAYHQLNIDLVAMQAAAIERAIERSPVKKIFVTGSFCSNSIFIRLLASRFPEIKVYTASMRDASALGAALVMHAHWNEGKEIEHLFDLQLCRPQQDIAIVQYSVT
jgi:hypothetical protein